MYFNLYFLFKIIILSANSLERISPLDNLGKHEVFKDFVTISGFSSGAAMASQVHLSHSKSFSGVGTFAGVYYRCAGATQNKTFCLKGGGENVTASIEDALDYEKQGLIDPLSNLKRQRVFIWIATLDDHALIRTRLDEVDFYQTFIPYSCQIHTKIQSSYHLLPTLNVRNKCTDIPKPDELYLANCNYSASLNMLSFLLHPRFAIKRPFDLHRERIKLESLKEFNQTEFFDELDEERTGMDSIGYYYLPKACRLNKLKKCLLHIFLHGSGLNRFLVKSFIEKSGFLEVGERNNIILIFPQAKATALNPQSGWDTFGFTGQDYANKNGVQIKGIANMLNRILTGK